VNSLSCYLPVLVAISRIVPANGIPYFKRIQYLGLDSRAAPGSGFLSEEDTYYSFSLSNLSPCYMREIINWEVPVSIVSVENRSERKSISSECSENMPNQQSRSEFFSKNLCTPRSR
jgi:hypothetical protein